TVLILVRFFAGHFMGLDAPPVDVTTLAVSMFMITAVPVVAGIAVRHWAAKLAISIEPAVEKLALVLFVVIVVGALAANWSVFVANLATLAPALVTLNVILLAAGLALARMFSLNHEEATAISIETGIQ